jgi:hypothetical protein
MALGKQAKILGDKQVRAVLAELDTRRYRSAIGSFFSYQSKVASAPKKSPRSPGRWSPMPRARSPM